MRATGPDLGLEEHGQDRRQEGRHHRRRARAPSICRPARCRARRSAARSAAAFRPTTSRTCFRSASTCVSNRSKVAAYRAPGAPIGAYAVECVLDELAEALKMDPLELRLKNAAKQGTKAAHGPVFPRIGYIETLEAGASTSALQGAARPSFRAAASRRGFWFNAGGESSRAGQHHRGRQRRRHHGPSRHRRLARRDRQHLRRAARHRLPPRLGPDRRHRHRRLLEPDRRQPRAVCLRHGGHAIGRKGHHHACASAPQRSGRSIPKR